MIFEWKEIIKVGQEDLEDDRGYGRPRSATNEQLVALVKNLIGEDW